MTAVTLKESSVSPAPHERRPKPTSKPVWVAATVAIYVVAALRAPGLMESLHRSVPEALTSRLHDPEMARLAVTIGAVIAIPFVAIMLGVVLAAALWVDRKLMPHSIALPRGNSVGFSFTTVALSLLSAQLWGLLVSGEEIAARIAAAVIVVVVLAGASWVFRRELCRERTARRIITVLLATLLAALSVIR